MSVRRHAKHFFLHYGQARRYQKFKSLFRNLSFPPSILDIPGVISSFSISYTSLGLRGRKKKKQGPISASPNCKQSKPIKRNKNKPEDCRGIYFSTKPVVGVANYPERRRVAGRRAGRPFPTASTSSVYAAAMSTVVLGKGLCGEGCCKMLITKRDFVRRSRFMSGCDSFQLLLIVVGIEVI